VIAIIVVCRFGRKHRCTIRLTIAALHTDRARLGLEARAVGAWRPEPGWRLNPLGLRTA
jgi:hypothetical protein